MCMHIINVLVCTCIFAYVTSIHAHINVYVYKMCYIYLQHLFCIQCFGVFLVGVRFLFWFWFSVLTSYQLFPFRLAMASAFLLSGVQGPILKDTRRVQNAFPGKKEKKKNNIKKQTASASCPCSPLKSSCQSEWETYHNTQVHHTQMSHSNVRHITVFRIFPLDLHIHIPMHTVRNICQNVSWYYDYNYHKPWLGYSLSQNSDKLGGSLESSVSVCRAHWCKP